MEDDESEPGAEEMEAGDVLPFPAADAALWEKRHARRRGGESSYRHQRPNQFYPIYVDPENKKVKRAGSSIPLDEEPDFSSDGSTVPVWPIDAEGNERCWRFVSERTQELIDQGRVVLGRYHQDRFLAAQREARDAGRGLWSACQAPAPTATSAPVVVQPTAATSPAVQPTQPPAQNCDPSYPTVCIPRYPPDLDCGQIPYRRFQVIGADPHGFDGDHDGVGCESG